MTILVRVASLLRWQAAPQAPPVTLPPALQAAVERFYQTQEAEDIDGYLALRSAPPELVDRGLLTALARLGGAAAMAQNYRRSQMVFEQMVRAARARAAGEVVARREAAAFERPAASVPADAAMALVSLAVLQAEGGMPRPRWPPPSGCGR